MDSYSVFYDNGDFTKTELENSLEQSAIDTVFLVGLATDYCVYWSALDALRLGKHPCVTGHGLLCVLEVSILV